ncbi:lung seven transmembrane receptor [Trichinella nativa]|uniref:Lung seven transmembrane receptor n=1 Tax=Trichinella nativa TaxID=6335 RepID=A0A1Y3E930_9BILA|nr:lung seven transmembrane receptor [Trichinella nativa]
MYRYSYDMSSMWQLQSKCFFLFFIVAKYCMNLLRYDVVMYLDRANYEVRMAYDHRAYIELSNFVYDAGGVLSVVIQNFTFPDTKSLDIREPVGFTLTRGDEILEYVKTNPNLCYLTADSSLYQMPAVWFVMDFAKREVYLYHKHGLYLQICPQEAGRRCFNENVEETDEDINGFRNETLKLSYENDKFSFQAYITEKNTYGYLSAGAAILPMLYMGFACAFFLLTLLWIGTLYYQKENLHKIHYLMAALVVLKTMSILIHGVHYNRILETGNHGEAWAFMFYSLHLYNFIHQVCSLTAVLMFLYLRLKGALLFGTLLLIGTGWSFFKNFLVERDRKMLMIIIPLQVVDNVALIALGEGELGDQSHFFWFRLFIMLDLLCCVAVILPVLWSIKHLEQASRTDGKASFNLEKLKLFQQFYIIIICYIYVTRIIKYLFEFSIPPRYSWVIVLLEESGTLIFFAITGYKFKPSPNNPYLELPQEEDIECAEFIPQPSDVDGNDVLFVSHKRMTMKKKSGKENAEQTATANQRE